MIKNTTARELLFQIDEKIWKRIKGIEIVQIYKNELGVTVFRVVGSISYYNIETLIQKDRDTPTWFGCHCYQGLSGNICKHVAVVVGFLVNKCLTFECYNLPETNLPVCEKCEADLEAEMETMEYER